MECPKCGDTTRKKMTGAVCDNYPCTWSTHDTSKFEIKLNGDMAQQFNEQEDSRDETAWHYGRDINGNEGYFEDFEQSIGEA